VRATYRQLAKDDIIRQFRFYLVTKDVPEVAVRFRQAVRLTVESLREHPRMASLYPFGNPRLGDLRAWPVAGFEAIRIYFVVGDDVLRVIRILHEKRNVRRILGRDKF
jgi:toxin ParE1/3/4